MRITKRAADALQPGQAIWDSELRGFGARRQKRDVSFILKCTIRGRQRFITIGRHGPLTVDEARARAKVLVGHIANGYDPSHAPSASADRLCLSELCERYLAEGPHYKPSKKASSWATDRSNIERHIVPTLGQVELSKLVEADVVRFVQAVGAGKTSADIKTGRRGRAIVKGGTGTASRSLSALSAILNFGIRVGLIDRNAAKHVEATKGGTPGRFLTRAEWIALGRALKDAEAAGTSPVFLNAIRLLALTGARKSEITTLEWKAVDLAAGTLTLSDSKVGPRQIPIGDQAIILLKAISTSRQIGTWVFPSRDGDKPIVGLQKIWDRVRIAAGLRGVRLHDLRHSFASEAVSSGGSLYVTGALLGHKQPRTTQRYAHIQRDTARRAATTAATEIDKALK